MLAYEKRSSSIFFFAVGACFPYVAATCTKLHTICNHYLTESTIEILLAKSALSNLAKVSWGSMPQTPLDTTCICRLWPHHLETAGYDPVLYKYKCENQVLTHAQTQ